MHSRGTEGNRTPPHDAGRPRERAGGVPELPDRALSAIANATQRAREATEGGPFQETNGRASRRQPTTRPVSSGPTIERRLPVESDSVWEPTGHRAKAHARPAHRRRRSRLARSAGTGIALGLGIAALIVVLNRLVSTGSHTTATVRTNTNPPTTAQPPTTLATPPPAPSPSSTTPVTTTVPQTTAPPATTPPTVVAPTTTTTATSPTAVVQDYFDAINAHDYQRAWAVGGDNLGSSYAAFAQGFSATSEDTLTSISSQGDTVFVAFVAIQDSGAQVGYQGTYTVSNGVIVGANIHQTSG